MPLPLKLKWEGRRRSAVFIDISINLTALTHKILTQEKHSLFVYFIRVLQNHRY
jgi:hypothetical protein